MISPLIANRPPASDIRPATGVATTVAEGVWMSPGLSNTYLVATPAGSVLINTGMGFEAPQHQTAYATVEPTPLRYIVLTQGHVDHVGGVDLLRGPDTQVIAHQANRACQADDARIAAFRARRSLPFFAAAIAQAARSGRPGAGHRQSVPVPDITFDDHYSFDLGDTRFELLSTPGETVDSLTVWLPQRRIAFVGNLFGALFGHFPNFSTVRGDRLRDPLTFLAAADRVLALKPELLCVGHFEPIRGADVIRAEITKIRDAVHYVHDAVIRGMNDESDVYTVMRETRLPDELRVGEGYGMVSWAVRAIWELYAGWFHARSTTELYGTPAADAHAAIVATAGTDPLAAAARAELTGGHPLRAIQLAEIVLTVHPRHTAAWLVYRDAHLMLRDQHGGENFWLHTWLELCADTADKTLTETK
ncbi:MBL fold metallo-hydrolase [Nocardia suismassiliense]|uniref:MBL fold metallo-hydrolase n=1 Tax=Nocardia suismassiliense TaxID=2077092 RepID=UPI000D1FB933|nr:MBL fold metallo-hydrolase [Nocardia suismassiliense]